jgi:hypothetical protein
MKTTTKANIFGALTGVAGALILFAAACQFARLIAGPPPTPPPPTEKI